MSQSQQVLWFESIGIQDVPMVGGKNASLGEMIQNLKSSNVRVPNGFATSAEAYRSFLSSNGLKDKIDQILAKLDVDHLNELAKAAKQIRDWIIAAPFPKSLETDIRTAYATLMANEGSTISVAVRSSATAEDLPDASFAGQQDTILNVRGVDELMSAIKTVYASLYTDRAISYRAHHQFDHAEVALSVGVQKMVRSDLAASGVMFTLDTESGFDGVVFITSAYGLGELVVQGVVNPDEFYVEKRALRSHQSAILKRQLGKKQQKMIYSDAGVSTAMVKEEDQQQFSLTDQEVTELADLALKIEAHYGRPMDIEWAKDGEDGHLYIVQARPETVQSRSRALHLENYQLKEQATPLVEGRSVGQKIGQGPAKVVRSVEEIERVQAGDVLVTDMTDPDWEPVMKRASAIVTNRGGRTCHAAIIARELGIPAVVGCGNATETIQDNQAVTVSCAEGDVGYVYPGILKFDKKVTDLESMPQLKFKIMMNVGNPNQAFDVQRIPNSGVGLARLEFIINQMIGVHPKACLEVDCLKSSIKNKVLEKSHGYESPAAFFRDKLAEGISILGAAFWPKPVIVRLSDFKSNEYANLIGGQEYEPNEENPMLGFRGASRYADPSFKDCFELECQAVKKVREEQGLTNIQVMIPFVRSPEEAQRVLEIMDEFGLKRGLHDLKVIMMCELPTNALQADAFLEHFDGFSIGSNDLTQLTLGVDRDSGIVAQSFNEKDPAVKHLLHLAIQACLKAKKYVGICGQGPSDHPDLAQWLCEEGIESVSLTPDSVIPTWLYLAEHLQ